jgi:Novel toxin 21
VRIDRSDLADGPDDTRMASRTRVAADDPDAAGTNRVKTVTGDRPPGSSPDVPGSTLRAERTAAYQAGVDAVCRQYAIDHGDARAEKLEPETASLAMRRIEAEGPESHTVGPDDRPKGKGRLTEAADFRKGDAPQTPEGNAAVAQDPSAPADHDGWIRGGTIRGDQSGEYGVVPRTPAHVHDYDLPQGYSSSPALKRDPYHPDSVAARSKANHELYAATSRDRAAALGYTTRIPAQKVPFDSHDQEAFTNGKNYITPDVDGHNVTNGWKMFSRRGVRIGTYDSELNYVKE